MMNKLVCLLSVVFLLSVMPAAQAGFFVKKQAVAIAAGHHNTMKSERANHIFSQLSKTSARPYYPFAYGGWVGICALIFGIAGFFYGGFAIAAVLFGIWGMGRRHKNKGMAIVGLVLGVVAIAVSIIGTFSGFPIF